MPEVMQETAETKTLKAAKPAPKKKPTAKKPQDTMTRFFNSYGDTPHL